jgi:hypothetical protein
MRLTDIVSGADFHKLSHVEESEPAHRERAQRIRETFGEPVMRCLNQCGGVLEDKKAEYSLIMATLALVDHVIEQCTSGKPS